eukprot:scaffold3178_cov109-Isochrysis_galbana.AAC.1
MRGTHHSTGSGSVYLSVSVISVIPWPTSRKETEPAGSKPARGHAGRHGEMKQEVREGNTRPDGVCAGEGGARACHELLISSTETEWHGRAFATRGRPRLGLGHRPPASGSPFNLPVSSSVDVQFMLGGPGANKSASQLTFSG